MDEESIARQREKDAAYITACREAGIEPDPPQYRGVGDSEHLDLYAVDVASGGALHNGARYVAHRLEAEPLKELTPQQEGAAMVLEILLPHRDRDLRTAVTTAGRRALVLGWLLGQRETSLADLAKRIGVSRASLSNYACRLSEMLNIHGRGQKSVRSREVYRESAKRTTKLRKLTRAINLAAQEGGGDG